MIELTYSNRSEALLAYFAAHLSAHREAGGNPLRPIEVVVPNRNVQRFCENGVAQTLGIAANIRFERLHELPRAVLGSRLLDAAQIKARVLRSLFDSELGGREEFAEIDRYVSATTGSGATERRRAQLAMRLAALFGEYAYARPGLVEAWEANALSLQDTPFASTERWQAALWRSMQAGQDSELRSLPRALAEAEVSDERDDPLYVFGVSYVAPVYSRLFALIAQRRPVHLYTLNPCEEFWEDVESEGEWRKRRREDKAHELTFEGDDPFGLTSDNENLLLRKWGRPGREHIRLLGALTHCDFEPAFVDPLDPLGDDEEIEKESEEQQSLSFERKASLLERIQHDVLARAPRPDFATNRERDASVQVLACPSIRREVESVAVEIWSLLKAESDLRFDQIAVLVGGSDRETYLPHIRSVFAEAHEIPFNLADISLAAIAPIVEATKRLVALPSTDFERGDVLPFLTHPNVSNPDAALAFARVVDEVGIFRGMTAEDLSETYAGAGNHLHWDQGLARIALGFFASDEDFVEVQGQHYLPQPSLEHEDGWTLEFGHLARSLWRDVREIQRKRLGLDEWASHITELVHRYLKPRSALDEAMMRRVLLAIASLRQWAVDADGDQTRYPYVVVEELVIAELDRLNAEKGEGLNEGVAISSLMPMRAIPFRYIFVLGLGEGRFPSTDRRDVLDLRGAKRQAGDVSSAERDRYTLLETLLCARDGIYLSYVAREERTGDPIAPSIAVAELLEAIEVSHLQQAETRLVRRPPLRRQDSDQTRQILPEAVAEKRIELLRASQGETDMNLQHLRTQKELRKSLGLAALPRREEPRKGELSLRTSALRRFLESPAQGWATSVLRLRREAKQEALRADELLQAERGASSSVLGSVLSEHLETGEDLRALYDDRVAKLSAKSQWPVGSLAVLQREEHLRLLNAWAELMASTFGASAGFSSKHLTSKDESFDFSLGEKEQALQVRIVGETLATRLKDEVLESVLVYNSSPKKNIDERTVASRALRAFLDQALLAASGVQTPREHRCLLLLGDPSQSRLLSLGALAEDTGGQWLKTLTSELLSGSHAYSLPIEAVLEQRKSWEDLSGEALVRSIERLRSRDQGSDRFGPLSEAIELRIPSAAEARTMASRRFGPFIQALIGDAS